MNHAALGDGPQANRPKAARLAQVGQKVFTKELATHPIALCA